jgi:hypothetical protein
MSLGDICKTKYWISIERRPFAWWRWGINFKPPYYGTTKGVLLMTPFFTILGHIRDLSVTKAP